MERSEKIRNWILAQTEKREDEEESGPRTHMPVIAVSRGLACGGSSVANRLSQILEWELWDRQIVDEIATNANVRREMVEALDERHQTEVEAILRGFSKERTIDRYVYRRHLVETVFTIAQRGKAVILGRGANFILDCAESTLSVRLTATIDIRIERLTIRENITRDEARKRIVRSDKQRRDFIKKMFSLDIDDAINYDLTIRTDFINIDDTADIIVNAVRAKFPHTLDA
jgi:cytidylate kinase